MLSIFAILISTHTDPDAGKDRRQEEKGVTEDKMVVWRHWLNGHEFEQAPGNSKGQGSLARWGPWGSKESDMMSYWTTTTLQLYLLNIFLQSTSP